METIFIALSNKSGIACASDRDHTIYQLSKKLPLALAVSPSSPIPWNRIIEQYKLTGGPEEKKEFSDYATHFLSFLSTIPVDKSWKINSNDSSKLLFMGYGKDDLFPCIYEVSIIVKTDKIIYEERISNLKKIAHGHTADISIIGNVNGVSTLIWGANNDTRLTIPAYLSCHFETYKNRVIEKFKDSEFADYVNKKLELFDDLEYAFDHTDFIKNDMELKVLSGIDSFSIEDLVTASETLVNAEVRLKHLFSGGKEDLHVSKEIAVITRTEGVTWIKHSLFAL
jgi:hypothetical protein